MIGDSSINLTIDLSPSEEARLFAAAKQSGRDPAGLVKKLVAEHLPAVPATDAGVLDAKLRPWQERNGTKLMLGVPAQALFAQWAEEDAEMTDEEREIEDRLWKDFEQGLSEDSRGLQLRWLN